MGERTPAVGVADRPDAGNVGGELVVDSDEIPRVSLDARRNESKIVRVGAAADGEQHMGANDILRPGPTACGHRHAAVPFLQGNAFRVQAELDTFALQYLLDRLGDVLVVAPDQSAAHLHDGDPATEAAVNLGEFQPDVAAPDDHQVLGQEIHVHHAGVGEVVYVADPGHVGDECTPADVDDDPVRLQRLAVDADRIGASSRPWPS